MTPSECIATFKQLNYGYFIVLKRRNYLRQQVSIEVAWQKQNRVWRQPAGTKATLNPITIDVEKIWFGPQMPLLDSFEERERIYLEAEQILESEQTLWLTYEDDILPDPQIGYKRVCEFLGISSPPVTIKRGRTNPFPLQDLILNFEEVAATLQGTPYEWMLHD